ncbi:MAG: Holliday junction branch migration protein RuvA [Pseudomonadota bacterium]
MIGRVRGILVEKRAPWLVVELANGLGYEIEAPMSTFYKLPELDQPVVLHIHQVVREDAHLLYGFFEERERIFFRNLIKVNGVGPKLALTILSNFDPNAFVICVTQNDVAGLTRVPGVGKKTAERLIIEMRDRLDDTVLSMPLNHNIPASSNSAVQEALSALVALGYKPQEASKAMGQIDTTDLSCETIIRQVLQRVMA